MPGPRCSPATFGKRIALAFLVLVKIRTDSKPASLRVKYMYGMGRDRMGVSFVSTLGDAKKDYPFYFMTGGM
jgi:hypothetical protein